jgi:hypothetical protein
MSEIDTGIDRIIPHRFDPTGNLLPDTDPTIPDVSFLKISRYRLYCHRKS